MPADLSTLPDDVEALRAIVVAQAAALAAKDGLIGTLRLQLARLRRQQFGRSSERLDRDIEQLELALEDLEAEQAAKAPAPAPPGNGEGDKSQAAPASNKPARRPLPDHLPRETVQHPAPSSCPTCGGSLRPLGGAAQGSMCAARGMAAEGRTSPRSWTGCPAGSGWCAMSARNAPAANARRLVRRRRPACRDS